MRLNENYSTIMKNTVTDENEKKSKAGDSLASSVAKQLQISTETLIETLNQIGYDKDFE